ncbi:SMC-Scp complex subunit ScpB [Candidatus Bathyarchaeota archaeon]|nr:SMC-Scp complex subunit ScpB [Candidatus Bathyarchaeota archaeon]
MEAKQSGSSEKEKFEYDMKLVEAALYVAGRPLELKTIASILGSRSKTRAQLVARALVDQYRQRSGALDVFELADGRFVLQLKPEFTPKVRRLAVRPLLTLGPLKTLSYIAFRQPVTQAQVISVRGPQAYVHIQILDQMGLISCEKLGRTRILRTTEVFADYFNLSHDLRLMKRQLQALFESLGKFPPPPVNQKPELLKQQDQSKRET